MPNPRRGDATPAMPCGPRVDAPRFVSEGVVLQNGGGELLEVPLEDKSGKSNSINDSAPVK